MQWVQLRPTQFIRIGLCALILGAAIVSVFETFRLTRSDTGGTGRCRRAGERLPGDRVYHRVDLRRGGYQIHSPLALLFSVTVLLAVLAVVIINDG